MQVFGKKLGHSEGKAGKFEIFELYAQSELAKSDRRKSLFKDYFISFLHSPKNFKFRK